MLSKKKLSFRAQKNVHLKHEQMLTLSDIIACQMFWTGVKNTIMVQDMRFIKLIKGNE